MKPLEVYETYVALKSHFNHKQKYDFHKYHGKIKSPEKSYAKRKDMYFFEKVSRNYATEEVVPLFLSVFVRNHGGGKWIGDIADHDKMDERYHEYIKKRENLFSFFKRDCRPIKMYMTEYDMSLLDVLKEREDKLPIVVMMLVKGIIELESFIILSVIFKLQAKYDSIYTNTAWKDLSFLVTKYLPFLSFNYDKFDSYMMKCLTKDVD